LIHTNDTFLTVNPTNIPCSTERMYMCLAVCVNVGMDLGKSMLQIKGQAGWE